MRDLRRMVEADTDPISAEIDALPPDADEPTRQSLAEKLAPTLARHLVDYPWLNDPAQHLSKGKHVTQQTFVDAVVALYNPAQLDVLSRASALAQCATGSGDMRTPPGHGTRGPSTPRPRRGTRAGRRRRRGAPPSRR